MPKDRTLAKANHIAAEWDKRTRELKKEMIWKQQAQDQGEETGSDDDNDDDDDEFDEAAAGVDWGVLEGEDSWIGTYPSTQGPFPFHTGEACPRDQRRWA